MTTIEARLWICRAEDGEIFETSATVQDIDRLGGLEVFIRNEIGSKEGALIAYLPDGRRLEAGNVQDLVRAQPQTIFVFNQYYMDGDIHEVMKLLHFQPQLQPPVEESTTTTPRREPSELAASYLQAAQVHQQLIDRTLNSLQHQQSALRIASSALDLHLLDVTNVFNSVAAGTRQELEKQASLIAGVDTDIELISRVPIHRHFISPSAQKATNASDPARTLGYYVSSERIRRAVSVCQKTHGNLQERFHHAAWTLKRLVDGATEVRLVRSNTKLLDEAKKLDQHSRETHRRASEAVLALDGTVADVEPVLQELRQSDVSIRRNLASMTELKNVSTEQCLHLLRQISTLKNDLVALPIDLFELQAQVRAKKPFSDVQRIHDMIYTYGATIIEIVRRKEFSSQVYKRYQNISEGMKTVLAAEDARRQAFRGDVQSQLPFDLLGLENAIKFSAGEVRETSIPYDLERSDIKDLMGNLEDLERYAETLKNKDVALFTIREACTKLEGLANKMDAFESGLDIFVGQPLLSSSQRGHSKQASKEFAQKTHSSEWSTGNGETPLHEERRALEAEVARLNRELRIAGDEHERVQQLEHELHQARLQIESETAARRILEDRYTSLLSIVERQQQELGDALSEAAGNTKAADQRTSQVHDIEGSLAQGTTEVAIRIQTRRAPDEDAQQVLDRVAGTDEGRVALTGAELRGEGEGVEHQRKEATIQVKPDAAGLRADPHWQHAEGGLRDTQHALNVLQEEGTQASGRASRTDLGHNKAEKDANDGFVTQLLEISIAYRTTHFKALALARSAVSQPSSHKESSGVTNPGNGQRRTTATITPLLPDEPSPLVQVDRSDPAGAIKTLRLDDHDRFLDVIAKTASSIHKWQKQCKGYRERAKEKISFRKFSKGDLALFLPLRKSGSNLWAAFTVSSSPFFLKGTDDLNEQLKTREWLVGRIASITERVVESNVPDSDPYGLGDGVKYYMLEIEDLNQLTLLPRRAERTSLAAADTDPGEVPMEQG